MAPNVDTDFVRWPIPRGDKTLGIDDFAIGPHLDHPNTPENNFALDIRSVGALILSYVNRTTGQKDGLRHGESSREMSRSMSSFEFRLDPTSGVPTYLQIVQQVEHALRLGYLEPGSQLPKVRDVVTSLAINPNTVSKAYRELETKGLIVGRPGQGTFISTSLGPVTLPELTGLRRSLRGWLSKADTAGLDDSGIAALVASELRDFYERRGGAGSRGIDDEAEGVA